MLLPRVRLTTAAVTLAALVGLQILFFRLVVPLSDSPYAAEAVIGFVLGAFAAEWQTHPRRALGLVPIGTAALASVLMIGRLAGFGSAALVALGFFQGLAAQALIRSLYSARSDRINRFGVQIVSLLVGGLFDSLILFSPDPFVFVAIAIVAWLALYPQALELLVEWLLIPFYRIRAVGPGAANLPLDGPLLVVANHAAYLDPFWLAKIVPRQARPMMTSTFYDKPVIHWLSRRVARAIRVPAGAFRREAPELQDAITALRHGECILLFPEGGLRRSDEQMLHPFGQGVWHILHDLPGTPVAVCWIEGGWGSFFSYKNGRPMQGKRMDWRRPIDIAVGEPTPLSPATLADHRTTRSQLHHACLECRRFLGLDVPGANASTNGREENAASESSAQSVPHQINP